MTAIPTVMYRNTVNLYGHNYFVYKVTGDPKVDWLGEFLEGQAIDLDGETFRYCTHNHVGYDGEVNEYEVFVDHIGDPVPTQDEVPEFEGQFQHRIELQGVMYRVYNLLGTEAGGPLPGTYINAMVCILGENQILADIVYTHMESGARQLVAYCTNVPRAR